MNFLIGNLLLYVLISLFDRLNNSRNTNSRNVDSTVLKPVRAPCDAETASQRFESISNLINRGLRLCTLPYGEFLELIPGIINGRVMLYSTTTIWHVLNEGNSLGNSSQRNTRSLTLLVCAPRRPKNCTSFGSLETKKGTPVADPGSSGGRHFSTSSLGWPDRLV